jgi:hypothetical protein
MWIAISIPIWLLAMGSLAAAALGCVAIRTEFRDGDTIEASRSIRAIAIYLAASSAFAAAAYNIARL